MAPALLRRAAAPLALAATLAACRGSDEARPSCGEPSGAVCHLLLEPRHP